MRSTALEVIFKKNKKVWKTIFKEYFESDKYAHKSENSLSQPQYVCAKEILKDKNFKMIIFVNVQY